MGRRSVSGNRSPNAGFLLVRSESGSSAKVSPKFHYAQAMCPGLMFCAAMLSLPWTCLFHDEYWRYVSRRCGVVVSPMAFGPEADS